MSIEWDIKEPMALFGKGSLSDCAVIGLYGWGEIIHELKQLHCTLLCYYADVRSQFSGPQLFSYLLQ